ncbi:MAG: methyltransferase domain-containing protein [Chloroflexi bacterium]|nr:methyltransferase domain-containing protein [Chloroflexota bacterium]
MNLIENDDLQLETLARLAQPPPLFEPASARFWDDPYIAQQLLIAHLDPDTEAASRKPETIDRTVVWLMQRLDLQPGAALLDLGCGPGLYTRRFAERGLQVTGVDFSENSIRYARDHDPRSMYIHADYLTLDMANSFDAVTLIYGDICVLSDQHRDTVLQGVRRALRPGGWFVFDITTPCHDDRRQPPSGWSVITGAGFWKPGPHLVLSRYYNYAEHDTGLEQYLVIENNGAVTEYRVWRHYYTPETIGAALRAQGFTVEAVYGDLTGTPYQPDSQWAGIVARKA